MSDDFGTGLGDDALGGSNAGLGDLNARLDESRGGIQQLLSTLPPVPSEGVDNRPQDVQDVRCVCFQQPILLRGSQ
ncbi:unnamed protein product, partial [Laminaria digitata]